MESEACEICGAPASVHVTDVSDGNQVERSLCPEHARAAGLPAALIPGAEANEAAHASVARMLLPKLKQTAAFLRRYGRLPNSEEELREHANSPLLLRAHPVLGEEMARELASLETLITFITDHGRLPVNPREV